MKLENGAKQLKDELYEDEVLDCGKPVNFTHFDELVGIANRMKGKWLKRCELFL